MTFERLAPEQHDTLDGIPAPPETLSLYGQGQACDLLAGAYRSRKFPHAWLFSGPQGIGKATLAFRLANHLLAHSSPSEAPDQIEAPDPRSALFRQIAIGSHPSVLHLTRPPRDNAKGFKTVITADEIRRVNRFLQLTSHDGGYRIVIVDPADDMNAAAANALLKNLEEPPSRTVFLLIAHNFGRLLPTIRSRCQRLAMMPLNPSDLRSALEAAGGPGTGEISASLLAHARGSVRRALLLSRHGGEAIAAALDALSTASPLNGLEAHKMSETVGGRDQGIRLGIFSEHALDLLAEAATAAARAGQGSRSDRISRARSRLIEATIETEAYNLDRKQYALSTIFAVNEALTD